MTLKQLQAEWRRFYSESNFPSWNWAADALTPYIEQQERDRELIEELLLELGNEINSPDWIKSDLYLIARSRLKEMEE